jgi:hypothetical protein
VQVCSANWLPGIADEDEQRWLGAEKGSRGRIGNGRKSLAQNRRGSRTHPADPSPMPLPARRLVTEMIPQAREPPLPTSRRPISAPQPKMSRTTFRQADRWHASRVRT